MIVNTILFLYCYLFVYNKFKMSKNLITRENHKNMGSLHSLRYVLLFKRMRRSCFSNLYRQIIILSILLLSILLWPSITASEEIVAIQSLNIKPYNDALRGFESACNCKVERFILSDKRTDVLKTIREAEPDIIIAIGNNALERVKEIKNVPIVYLMILSPQSVISEEANITGISMNITPKKQLAVIHQALPDIKSIGLLYDPGRTGYFVKKAELAARAIGIKLIAKEIRDSRDLPRQLKSMKGEINAFWMLPDVTVVTPETVEFLLLFSIENRIPVITFSNKYLEMGALISLNIDAYDMGKQAWEITKKVLSGTDIKRLKRTDARKTDVTINKKTATKLGIFISDKILNKARVINQE